jgi:hypothetical protein
VKELMESANICERIVKSREAVEILEELEIIPKTEASKIKNHIDGIEKKNFVYVTKPFESYPSVNRHAYILMKSRINAVKIINREDCVENQ